MEPCIGSLAMIRHPDFLESHWLGLWSADRQQHEMIFAPRLENETFLECLDREIAWQLPWRRGKDYLISKMARIHIERMLQLPGDFEERPYVIEVFVVDSYGKDSLEQLEQQPGIRWLTNQELLDRQTENQEQIDPWLTILLQKFDLIPKHV